MSSVADELERLERVLIASEDWAKTYHKAPDQLAKLIKLEAKLGRLMRRYFKELASRVVDNHINWALYQSKNVKAYNFSVIVDVEEIDDQEYQTLLNLVHDPLLLGMEYGAMAAEEQYNISTGLNQYSDAIMKSAESYTGKLIKGINQTTLDRVQQSISTSLHLGEDVDAATERLGKVINDSYRAQMIARTESVRSYTRGIVVFGKESGATQKVWELSSNPCEICQGNYDNTPNGDGVIDINDDFDDGDPPPHPNCRCGISLIHDYSDPEDNSSDE